MDQDAKKTALRMIPYGLYVLTAETDGKVAAATINWVTQGSFEPPLVVAGVKQDSFSLAAIKAAGAFALNVLGKEHSDAAYTFFKALERDGDSIGGMRFQPGRTGAPVLDDVPAYVECNLIESVEHGDHAVVVGEVVAAGVRALPEGRPDDATLWLKDLGEKVFYGG